MRRIIKRAINMLGYDLRKYSRSKSRDLIGFLESREVEIVFDVGANEGQFAKMLRSAGYRGEIVSFEPVDTVFQQLLENMKGDRKWCGYNLALGDRRSREQINVSRKSVFSSIRSQTSAAKEFDVDATTTRVTSINVETLDTIVAHHRFSRGFLKVDTQGYEEQVLAGSRSTLPKLVGVQLELPIIHLYENVWKFSEACKTMEALGFAPSIISSVNYEEQDRFSMIEVDCLFRSTSLHESSALNG